jgi:hypothetical protein
MSLFPAFYLTTSIVKWKTAQENKMASELAEKEQREELVSSSKKMFEVQAQLQAECQLREVSEQDKMLLEQACKKSEKEIEKLMEEKASLSKTIDSFVATQQEVAKFRQMYTEEKALREKEKVHIFCHLS